MNNIVESVNKELTTETTTTANIAYLPSGFIPVQNAFRALAKLKPSWGIEIIPESAGIKFRVEDKLTVDIAKDDWKNFIENVVTGNLDFVDDNNIMFTGYLNEAVISEVKSLHVALSRAFYKATFKSPVQEHIANVRAFRQAFPGGCELDMKDVLLVTERFTKDVKRFIMSDIVEHSLHEDKGYAEMVLSALRKQNSLHDLSIFENHKYLLGTRTQVSYAGVPITYTSLVDNAFQLTEKVIIANTDVIDAIEEYDLHLTIRESSVSPRSRYGFDSRFFNILKEDIIAELAEDGDLDNINEGDKNA